MTAVPIPDNGERREQDVWFKFSQVDCEGQGGRAGAAAGEPYQHQHPHQHQDDAANTGGGGGGGGGRGYGVGKCTAQSQYWENYWYSRTPGKEDAGTAFGPAASATAAGFYLNLLAVYQYWNKTKVEESMMELSLPDVAGTNGTWLNHQATHAIIRTMINRRETFHPTYGVSPGYGWQGQDGFQDVFTTTATMALEWGSFPYAKGVIDNQFSNYVRHDGLINYRATEVPQCSRFLTVLALYFSYTNDDALLEKHFYKARALANWLLYRRKVSLGYPKSDAR